MKYLSEKDVIALHEMVILPEELQGLAGDKSLSSVLARIQNRIQYGLVSDVFNLAGCYACYFSVAHVFNDANKRKAFACMDTCLAINGIELEYKPEEIGTLMIRAAQGLLDDQELAHWLRNVYLNKKS